MEPYSPAPAEIYRDVSSKLHNNPENYNKDGLSTALTSFAWTTTWAGGQVKLVELSVDKRGSTLPRCRSLAESSALWKTKIWNQHSKYGYGL